MLVGLGGVLVLRGDIGEAAAHQLCPGVEIDRLAVYLADEGVDTATYHAVFQILRHSSAVLSSAIGDGVVKLDVGFLEVHLADEGGRSVAPSTRSIPESPTPQREDRHSRKR